MAEDKINLLFVDDEAAFLESMTKRLEVRGFNVIAVDRGEKAVEAAKNLPVDIVLLDLKMPGLGGEETLKILKEEHAWLEVVVLTGHGSVDSAVETTRSGAYKYLQKPCELDQLLAALQEAYKQRIMNKKQIDREKMDRLLDIARVNSPGEILRKLKEMDS